METNTIGSYHGEPCKRCGSKKIVVQLKDEVLEDYSGSSSILKITQIVCTNAKCQRAFERQLVEEENTRLAAKLFKEQQDKIRKENAAQAHIPRLKVAHPAVSSPRTVF